MTVEARGGYGAPPDAQGVLAGAATLGEVARVLAVFSRGAMVPEARRGGAAAAFFVAAEGQRGGGGD